MSDLKIRVPDDTHQVAALLALRYQQSGGQLEPSAVDEIAARLSALGDQPERQELLDALISLGAVAVMLRKLGDIPAHEVVMDLIRTQLHRFADLGDRVVEAMAQFADRPS